MLCKTFEAASFAISFKILTIQQDQSRGVSSVGNQTFKHHYMQSSDGNNMYAHIHEKIICKVLI